jgi:hypothetical protein
MQDATAVGRAIAGPKVTTGPLLQHERKIFGTHAGCRVPIDVALAHDHIRSRSSPFGLGRRIDRRGITTNCDLSGFKDEAG